MQSHSEFCPTTRRYLQDADRHDEEWQVRYTGQAGAQEARVPGIVHDQSGSRRDAVHRTSGGG